MAPVADVDLPVRPLKTSFTLLKVIFVLAGVLPAIWPREDSRAIHLVKPPLSDIVGAIFPPEGTLSTFKAILVVSFVLGSICPCLFSQAVELVAQPLALVRRAVCIIVAAVSVRLIIEPLTDVAIPV